MDVHEAISNRRSVRSYSSKSIPAEVMERMRQALRFAPSAANNQPWHFILVQDQTLREDLAKAAHDQSFVAQAPVVVVACGFPDQASKRMGGHFNSVDIDVAIGLDHLTLAAVEEGLGTCWIGAFDEQKVKALVAAPEEVKIVALTPLGYPATSGLIRPLDESLRKPEAEVFSTDRFGSPLK